MRASFNTWALHELESADLIKGYFNLFLKYGYHEIGPLKEIFRERDQRNDTYQKALARLVQKKEKLWLSGDVNKWGLTNEDLWNASVLKSDKALAQSKMCKKDSVELEKFRDDFAYMNFQSRSEIRRFLLDNQLIENLHFTEFAKNMCSHTTKIHVCWGELIANLSRIRCENIPSRSYISKVPKNF
jgi:exonuclease III